MDCRIKKVEKNKKIKQNGMSEMKGQTSGSF